MITDERYNWVSELFRCGFAVRPLDDEPLDGKLLELHHAAKRDARSFFDEAPTAVKLLATDLVASKEDAASGQVGYIELLPSAAKEMFVVRGVAGSDSLGDDAGHHRNFPWPLMPSSFSETVQQYFSALRALAITSVAEIVDVVVPNAGSTLPHLFAAVDTCSSVLFLRRYRQHHPNANAHTDSGILTVMVAMCPDDVKGLEVLANDANGSSWINVSKALELRAGGATPRPFLVMMTGEMFGPLLRGVLEHEEQRGSNMNNIGRYAVPHRVRCCDSSNEGGGSAVSDRLTMPFQLRLPLTWSGFASQLVCAASSAGGHALSISDGR